MFLPAAKLSDLREHFTLLPSVRRPSVRTFHQFFQYISGVYGILRTLGHLDILTFFSCDFPGYETFRER